MAICALAIPLATGTWACGGGAAEDAPAGRPGGATPGGRADGAGGGPGGRPGGGAAVPVEIAAVERRSVSSYLETNGTLEAEYEVDVVTRTAGPIVELLAEEGMQVREGQALARIDDRELKAQVATAEVALAEMRRNHERALAARDQQLISEEVYDQALAAMESAEAVLNERQIQLAYTTVTAPFDGVIVERAVKGAENLAANQRLFRISDFNPLLCPIQVPEKELSNLRVGQPGYVVVESWPGQRFSARVLRISPVIDAVSGTIKVTLEVSGQGKLRPGMFASVFLVIDTHENALVIPKQALSLESLADAVYIVADGVAARRDVTLGFEEAEVVEVTGGLQEGDQIIVVGQDGLSDGTPLNVLAGGRDDQPGRAGTARGQAAGGGPGRAPAAAEAPAPGGRPAGGRPAAMAGPGERPAGGQMDPEQMRERLKARGLSDAQIEERLQQMQERPQQGGAPPNR
jgi:membrane fusion protein (multidrug efflux system)